MASIELGVHPDVAAAPADAPLEDVAHAERPRDLAHVLRLALVGEGRVPGNDEEPRHLRQVGDQVLRDPVREVGLLRLAAHVLERQDRDGGLAGQRQRARGTRGRSATGPPRRLPGDARGDGRQQDRSRPQGDPPAPRPGPGRARRRPRRWRRGMRPDRVGVHRLGNVLDRPLAPVLEHRGHLAAHRGPERVGHHDPTRLGQLLEPRRDVHTVAVHGAVGLLDHVAQVHADPEPHPPIGGHGGRGAFERVLDRERGRDRAGRGIEDGQHRVAGHVDDAALVGLDLRAELVPRRVEGGDRRPLVRGHEARVPGDIRHQDGREPLPGSGVAQRGLRGPRAAGRRVTRAPGARAGARRGSGRSAPAGSAAAARRPPSR